jgi:DNA-binding helix-hairpin-helix protein with protein kinase domain
VRHARDADELWEGPREELQPNAEEPLLPAVEDSQLQPQPVTVPLDRRLLQQMAPQNGNLLFCGVVLACFLHAFCRYQYPHATAFQTTSNISLTQTMRQVLILSIP